MPMPVLVLVAAAAPLGSSAPATKTRCREAMGARQMGHLPEVRLTLVRQPSQPHWWPHGAQRKVASLSRHTAHVGTTTAATLEGATGAEEEAAEAAAAVLVR